MNKIELLAPAGSLEALEAAVEGGADAVYIGGTKFNARAFADNLQQDALRKAVQYAHIRGVKIYVTLNVLILQEELAEVLDYVQYLYSIDVDAVIVQDIGLAMMIREFYPDFEVHCSTQMAIHNSDGASLLREIGVERVVLARELSLREVDDIVGNTGVEAEIFVHGALCVCYSGQCYMSSLIGGRSGNRGKCAQPCRKKYRLYDTVNSKEIQGAQGSYLISTRDLNTYERLNEIAASKAASLKIEGRMKRPEYVAIIVHHYREALDCIQKGQQNCVAKEADYELTIAFNREFTQGYLFENRQQDITSIRRPDNRGIYIGKVLDQKGNMVELLLENNFIYDGDGIEIIGPNGKSAGTIISGIKKNNETVRQAEAGDRIRIFLTDRVVPGSTVNKISDSRLFQKAREEYAFKNKKKISLSGIFRGRINEAPTLTIKDFDGNQIHAAADEIIQAAQKQAVTEEKIAEQLRKTNDTPFVFHELTIDIQPNSFLSIKAINGLRREALELMTEKRSRRHERGNEPIDTKKETALHTIRKKTAAEGMELIAGVTSIEAGISALKAGADTLYIIGDYRYNENQKFIAELAKHSRQAKAELYYVFPQVTRDKEVSAMETMLRQVLDSGHKLGLVLSNLGQLNMAKRLKAESLRGNFTLNAANSAAVKFLENKGISSIGASPELNLTQIKALYKAVNIDLEAMVYGYLPAMITEYCPLSAAGGCVSCNSQGYGIIDERDKLFPVVKMGNCKSTILNSDVLCAYEHLSNITDSGASKLRLDFYIEKEDAVFDITKAFKEKLSSLRDNQQHGIIEEIKKKGYTKGHYFRGID